MSCSSSAVSCNYKVSTIQYAFQNVVHGKCGVGVSVSMESGMKRII
jgi:hypothetical protein